MGTTSPWRPSSPQPLVSTYPTFRGPFLKKRTLKMPELAPILCALSPSGLSVSGKRAGSKITSASTSAADIGNIRIFINKYYSYNETLCRLQGLLTERQCEALQTDGSVLIYRSSQVLQTRDQAFDQVTNTQIGWLNHSGAAGN